MFQWTQWFRKSPPARGALTRVVLDDAAGRACGVYHPLYKYLQNRYATTVVLRLSEIEDILGFALPSSARSDRGWWTGVDADASTDASTDAYRGAWTSARRSAVPNFPAGIVVFERAA